MDHYNLSVDITLNPCSDARFCLMEKRSCAIWG